MCVCKPGTSMRGSLGLPKSKSSNRRRSMQVPTQSRVYKFASAQRSCCERQGVYSRKNSSRPALVGARYCGVVICRGPPHQKTWEAWSSKETIEDNDILKLGVRVQPAQLAYCLAEVIQSATTLRISVRSNVSVLTGCSVECFELSMRGPGAAS